MRTLLTCIALITIPCTAFADDDAVAESRPATPAIRVKPLAAKPKVVCPSSSGDADAAVPTWTLDTTKSLRDNIDDWAASAGWTLDWLANDPYEVLDPVSPLPGDFPGVLMQLADSTPLTFCAERRTRRLVVIDQPLRCKDRQ